MTALTLHRIDLTPGPQPAAALTPAAELPVLGVRLSRLTGGDALIDGASCSRLALERKPQSAHRDNPGLLRSLQEVGIHVRGFSDFRQFDTEVTAPRADPRYRDLLGRAATLMHEIGATQRPPIDTAPYRRLGDARPGFRITLVTDPDANRVLGFLGHSPEGERIFLSADGAQARLWRT
jgi:hypothetical protein